jgi:DNA-directed RNA polymerase subunit RPC12/RpoP
MKCSFCGHDFSENEGIKTCSGCPIANCNMVKCPHCGYEILPEPKWIKSLKRRLKHADK